MDESWEILVDSPYGYRPPGMVDLARPLAESTDRSLERRAAFRRALKNRPAESIEQLLENVLTKPAARSGEVVPTRFRYGINRIFQIIGWDLNLSPLLLFLIGRLARLGGVNLETIRYYEREKLLQEPPRTPAGYRLFPSETVRRLRFIKHAQELGFSLSEIRELLALRMKPGSRRQHIRARAEAKIADIAQKIRALTSMKKTLRNLTERCDGCGPLSDCPILESLDEEVSD